MGASRVKSNRTIMMAAGLGLAVGALSLCGCASHPDKTVITDDSQVRLGEARQLAAQAQEAQLAGKTDQAIALYQQSLAQTKELGFVQNNLGILLMEQDNYLGAVALFEDAAEVMPESAKPLYNTGLAYSRRGWDEKAMGYFEKALAREPSDRDTLRAAVVSAKRLDRSDDSSMARVRRALMIETDPRWKRLEESEQFRIEGLLAKAKENAPLAVPIEGAPGETDRAAPGPVMDTEPVPAPGPVVPPHRTNPPSAPIPGGTAPAPMNPTPAAPAPTPATPR
jgi:tetratricopeptide (TPR) repeat protein